MLIMFDLNEENLLYDFFFPSKLKMKFHKNRTLDKKPGQTPEDV